MKKIIKILIILILIGIFINITLSRYVDEKSDISRKIGSVWNGGQITTYNYSVIIKNFEHYINYLKKEDYENAYKFLPYNYKQYKVYESFIEESKKIEYTNVQVVDIIRRTEYMYSIFFETNNKEKIEYLMIFNEDNTSFTITPETFLEYKEYKEEIEKRKVKYELINTVNFVDKYVAKLKITNLDKKEIANIADISLILNNAKHIMRK